MANLKKKKIKRKQEKNKKEKEKGKKWVNDGKFELSSQRTGILCKKNWVALYMYIADIKCYNTKYKITYLVRTD